jgi:hypothetical protein
MTATSPEHQFLRADLWENWPDIQKDQKRGPVAPTSEKPYNTDYQPIQLIPSKPFEKGMIP